MRLNQAACNCDSAVRLNPAACNAENAVRLQQAACNAGSAVRLNQAACICSALLSCVHATLATRSGCQRAAFETSRFWRFGIAFENAPTIRAIWQQRSDDSRHGSSVEGLSSLLVRAAS